MANDWKALATSDLIAARSIISMVHKDARVHGDTDLRDLAEDVICKIDLYGIKNCSDWQTQDMGAV